MHRADGLSGLVTEADWPVCLLAASYQRVLDALTEAIDDLDTAGRAEIMGGTAGRVYGLR